MNGKLISARVVVLLACLPPVDTSTPQTNKSTMSDLFMSVSAVIHRVILYFARNDRISQAYDYLNSKITQNSNEIDHQTSPTRLAQMGRRAERKLP
jgi:hypothetical protein